MPLIKFSFLHITHFSTSYQSTKLFLTFLPHKGRLDDLLGNQHLKSSTTNQPFQIPFNPFCLAKFQLCFSRNAFLTDQYWIKSHSWVYWCPRTIWKPFIPQIIIPCLPTGGQNKRSLGPCFLSLLSLQSYSNLFHFPQAETISTGSIDVLDRCSQRI